MRFETTCFALGLGIFYIGKQKFVLTSGVANLTFMDGAYSKNQTQRLKSLSDWDRPEAITETPIALLE